MMLFILVIVAPALVSSASRPPGLYTDRDPVIILNDNNFHKIISNKEHAWVVEFYASWCGYCRNFAPTFSRFAGEMTQWGDVIQVAVIDCGDDVNAETICMGANLTGYPTIKYYLPFTNTLQGEYGYNRESHVSCSYSRIYLKADLFQDHSGEALLVDTIDFVESMIDQMVELNPNIQQLWPALGQNSNDSSLFGFVNPDLDTMDTQAELVIASQVNRATENLIIVEDEASYVGKQVILDKWRRKEEQPIISRISVPPSNKDDVLRKLNVSSLPIVAIVEPDTENVILLKPDENSENLKKGLEKVVDAYFGVNNSYMRTTLQPISTDVSTLKYASEGDIIRRRYSVYQSDLDKTVISSLSNEVLLRSSFTKNQRETLYQYLNILSRFYPTEGYAYSLISNLYEKINQTEDVELLRSIVDKYPVSLDWVGCKGSSEFYGGYTCGLWTLWHFLTVAQAEAASGDPTDVLMTMTYYVRDFFGCQECSEHFLRMVDDGDNITSVGSYEEAVLYLWDRHNEVNLRLIDAEQADDPVYPKEYFPNVYYCPSCFPDGGYGDNVDEKEILNFLIKHYKKDSLLRGSERSSASLSNLVTKDSFVNLAMILLILL